MVRFIATTADITVTVQPVYLDGSSDLFEQRFAFVCAVSILNDGYEDVEIVRRRITISEMNGGFQEMDGSGTFDKRPVIRPGETYQHQEECVIHSFDGRAEGNYLVQLPNGARFQVAIPAFPLHAAAN